MNLNFLLIPRIAIIKPQTTTIARTTMGKEGIVSLGGDGCKGASGGEYPIMFISKT